MSTVFAHVEPDAVWHQDPTSPMLFHEYANLFPMLERDALFALVDDVRVHGVHEPIVMFEGKILDGRNRYMAARECGRPYPLIEYTGSDPLAYVVSLNLTRRHLSESQRAMVAAKLAKLPHGHRQSGQLATVPTQKQAATLLNVGARSVRRAAEIHASGTDALVASVEAGTVTVAAASEVARLPSALQAEVIAAGPEAVREIASELRETTTGDNGPDDKAALREMVVTAAIEGLRNGGSPRAGRRRNPLHEENPAFDAMAQVASACRSIVELVGAQGPGFIIEGFLDNGVRDRNVATFRAGGKAITDLLEACDGRPQ